MTTTTTDLTAALVTVLNAHERAKSHSDPASNPLAGVDLKDMATAGLRASVGEFPAQSMSAKGWLGAEMEQARRESLGEARKDQTQRRKAQARARAQRKIDLDKIADSPVRPSRERMDAAWMIVLHLSPIIDTIAKGKARWAARFLGASMDDVPQMAKEKMALTLAKSTKDLDLLERAARELGEHQERTGLAPGDQSEEEAKGRKALSKARKWLMGVVNNRVMGAVVDAYTGENVRWENIDILATVMATINGVGEDPMTARFKADRSPAMLGYKFQKPGGIDASLLAAAISAAITNRGLDALVEFILDDEHRRVDGAVKWSEHAEAIFKLTPGGDGEWMWDTVVAATTGYVPKTKAPWTTDRARKARGDAARKHVRSLFAWLPSTVVAIVEAFDPHILGFTAKGPATVLNHQGEPVRVSRTATDTRINAVLASEFELFYLPEPMVRQPLVPVLKFADSTEAASALLEHLAELVTGEDLLASAVNA